MKRCPKCNCGAEFTNKAEYYASHAGGAALGLGAGLVASVFHPSSGGMLLIRYTIMLQKKSQEALRMY